MTTRAEVFHINTRLARSDRELLLLLLAPLFLAAMVTGCPAQTFSTIKHFYTTNDGYSPQYGVVQDADGTLYGAAMTGDGTVFKVRPDGSGFTVLHRCW